MLSDYIAPEFVSIDNESVTYQDAIVFAGKALLDAGYITQDYIDAMIEIAEHSKYIVICKRHKTYRSEPFPVNCYTFLISQGGISNEYKVYR